MTMQDRPNERLDDDVREQLRDEADGERAGAGNEGAPSSTRSTRWVQLAYDLEQYGDGDPENRGEVY